MVFLSNFFKDTPISIDGESYHRKRNSGITFTAEVVLFTDIRLLAFDRVFVFLFFLFSVIQRLRFDFVISFRREKDIVLNF